MLDEYVVLFLAHVCTLCLQVLLLLAGGVGLLQRVESIRYGITKKAMDKKTSKLVKMGE